MGPYLRKPIAWHFTQSRSHAKLYSCSIEAAAALTLCVERQEPISWEYSDSCAYTALQSASSLSQAKIWYMVMQVPTFSSFLI